MKAATWYGPGKENLKIEDVRKPICNKNDIIVNVKACYLGAMHVRAVKKGHPKLTPPVIGFEGRMISGEIVEVGESVYKLKKGMKVTVNPEVPCYKCYYCKIGEYAHCENPIKFQPGGFAEYVLIPEFLLEEVYPIPNSISYEEAAYTETLACCLYGVEKANVKISDKVVVIGAGNVGLNFVQLLKIRGATEIIVLDKYDERLEIATKLGATYTINVQKEDPKDQIMKITAQRGADIVIEAVGSSMTYKQSFNFVRNGGTIIGFGGCPPNSEFLMDPNIIHYKSLKVLGSYHYYPELYSRAFETIIKKMVNLKPIITTHFPLTKIHDAIDCYGAPSVISIVIHP